MSDQPRISADGRFYWDSERWAPLPTTTSPTKPAYSRAAGTIVLVGGIGTVVATFIPWVQAPAAPFQAPLSWPLINVGDGQIIAVMGALAGLAGIVMFVRGISPDLRGMALLLFALVLLVTVIVYGDLIRVTVATYTPVMSRIGPGPYVSILAAMAGIGGGVIAFFRTKPIVQPERTTMADAGVPLQFGA